MSHRLIIASKNPDKIREIKNIFKIKGLKLVSVDHLPEVEEDGLTYYENALKKAREISLFTGEAALADDSGLDVDFLGGAPGVNSGRYAGPDKDYASNNRKLLKELDGVPPEKRTARFHTTAVIYFPNGKIISAEAICEGVMLGYPRGVNGFGYDPLFFVTEKGMTMAEMNDEEKNMISHRGRALRNIKRSLEDHLQSFNT